MTYERSKDDAIFSGLIGLAAIFFASKDFILPDNMGYFILLISVFLLVCLWRVFGTVLEFKGFNNLAIDFFALIVTPVTAFVLMRILVTQIVDIGKVLPSQVFVLPMWIGSVIFFYMLVNKFKIDFNFKISRKNKSKSSK